MSSTAMVSSTTQSSMNGVRLRNPPVRSKPALLNAEMEWKMPHQIPSGSPGGPASGPAMNAIERITAPTASMTSEKIAIRLRIVATPPSWMPPIDSWARTRSRSAVRRPKTSSNSSVEPAMIPNPPAWMSSRITTWPNGLQ